MYASPMFEMVCASIYKMRLFTLYECIYLHF